MDEMQEIKIDSVISVAKQAGSIIMQELTTAIHVTEKTDESPVTQADKKADASIKQALRKITPDIPILSEEDTPEERAAAISSPFKWVVDPLDGTRTAIQYANGKQDHNQFGVHIALLHNGSPIAGVAYFPAMADGKGICYFTGDNGKAYKQTGDSAPKEIHVAKPPFKPEGMRAAVHVKPERRAATIANRAYVAVPGIGGQRICLVAEGAADIADMNDIPASHQDSHAYKQWDLAASHAILRAAGGDMVAADSKKPLNYANDVLNMPGAFAGGRETLKFLNFADLPPAGGGLQSL